MSPMDPPSITRGREQADPVVLASSGEDREEISSEEEGSNSSEP